jgi:hypothetical protein
MGRRIDIWWTYRDLSAAASPAVVTTAMLVYSTGGRQSERPERVYPYILGLATGNPPYKVSQKDALQIALKVSRNQNINEDLRVSDGWTFDVSWTRV